jgi:excisionase family DNA binding protein
MVDARYGRTQRAPASPKRPTVQPWPSALDIPQRITASGRPDHVSNDNTPDPATERLYSLEDVQELWGVSDTTLYREIRAGKLDALKIRGQWRIPSSSLVAYRKANDKPVCLPGHPRRGRGTS